MYYYRILTSYICLQPSYILHLPSSLLSLFYLSSTSPPSLKKPEPLTMWGCLSRVYLATLAPDGELILLAFQQEVGPHLEQEPAQARSP